MVFVSNCCLIPHTFTFGQLFSVPSAEAKLQAFHTQNKINQLAQANVRIFSFCVQQLRGLKSYRSNTLLQFCVTCLVVCSRLTRCTSGHSRCLIILCQMFSFGPRYFYFWTWFLVVRNSSCVGTGVDFNFRATTFKWMHAVHIDYWDMCQAILLL